ncbi:MAG: TlyA family RNA methyltransferase [Spirochaetia bacterium]|nr:TlyA family RNA methyltransferase [Spirochaetia bacterium]
MRLDEYLVSRKYAKNLRQAEGLVLSGNVLVNNTPVTSAGYPVKLSDETRIRNQKKWVARSAEKLDFALEKFQFDVAGKQCLDIGASTGGFTQVLLHRGAKNVIALDVAYGFLHSALRNDPSVILMDRTHICQISSGDLPWKPDIFVADVSFISLKKVIPCLKNLFENWEGFVLLKPQFEVEPVQLKKGIVTDDADVQSSVDDFAQFLKTNRIKINDIIQSPIQGKKGNREFIFWIQW